MRIITDLKEAEAAVLLGKIIAYPTEHIYGLGCNPFNQDVVHKLLQLKKRDAKHGLILLISSWSQLTNLIGPIPEDKLQKVKSSWPGQVTWVFPKSVHIPQLISGEHETVAIRMTAHPVAKILCKHIPIVSTSANISGCLPTKDIDELARQFTNEVDGVVAGALGNAETVSPIYDVLNGKRLR